MKKAAKSCLGIEILKTAWKLFYIGQNQKQQEEKAAKTGSIEQRVLNYHHKKAYCLLTVLASLFTHQMSNYSAKIKGDGQQCRKCHVVGYGFSALSRTTATQLQRLSSEVVSCWCFEGRLINKPEMMLLQNILVSFVKTLKETGTGGWVIMFGL